MMVLIRTTNNLHIIGKKSFWKNLFKFKSVTIDNPYFVDFTWNGSGQVEKVYMNTMKLLYAESICTLNNRHILFSTKPDSELVDIYNSMTESVEKNNKHMVDLL